MKRIAFDTEDTHVRPGCRLVEIAGILFDENGVYDVFETLVNPGMPLMTSEDIEAGETDTDANDKDGEPAKETDE